MDGQRRRVRSATLPSDVSQSKNVDIASVRTLVESLQENLSKAPESARGASFQARCEYLHRIRQYLIDTPDAVNARDAFRNSGGFDVLLSTLRSLSGFYDGAIITDEERIDFFAVVQATLDVLSEALHEHPGNRRYFSRRVEGDGWSALELALASTGICGKRSGNGDINGGEESFFGCLIAFAIGEEAVRSLFRDITSRQISETKSQKSEEQGKAPKDRDSASSSANGRGPYSQLTSRLRKQIQISLTGKELLRNPEIVPVLTNFWLTLRKSAKADSPFLPLVLAVLLVLDEVTLRSDFNRIALHGTGVLSTFLRLLLSDEQISYDSQLLLDLATRLAELGVNRLEDAHYLFRKAISSTRAAEFLLRCVTISRGPAFIQFDLSLHGHSSVELPSLGRPFPPAAPSLGYTVTAWLRVNAFDPSCHTTLFGAYNHDHNCFVLIYLEKDTSQLILQTSTKGANPSVRFKTVTFREGLWYHIAVVHRRAKGSSSSRAALFVNGEFSEQVKCQYPMSSNAQAVQAFLGTPQDLAPRLGRNVISSRWSLASFHLFQEPLSDELVAVYQKLGPRYSGNFQDCLGSFQTYRASAELYLYNELLHPGREENSQIVSAIRSKASRLLSESQIMMSISPYSIMDDDDHNNVDESQLMKSLSRGAAKNLQRYTRAKGNAVLINGAVPSINDALTQPHGVGILVGNPIFVVPQSFDDACWRIGGCVAVCLNMVKLAHTREHITRAVKIFFECIDSNWRNSEAMEGENGFGALAALLREKLGFDPVPTTAADKKMESTSVAKEDQGDLACDLLRLVLRFTGFDDRTPEDSVLLNPLAYRILLVDFDIWRKASLATQRLYYSQFVCFGAASKHHHFNAKRLIRMSESCICTYQTAG